MISLIHNLFKKIHFNQFPFCSSLSIQCQIQHVYDHIIDLLKKDLRIISNFLSLSSEDYFIFHGTYTRTFSSEFDSDISIRIQRIMVFFKDGSTQTHALIPFFLVPYSRISLSLHIKAALSEDHDLAKLASRYLVDFHSLKNIYSRYQIYWSSLAIISASDIIHILIDYAHSYGHFYFQSRATIHDFCSF